MITNRIKKPSILIPIILAVVVFYITIRILTEVGINGGEFTFEIINSVMATIHRLDTRLYITARTFGIAIFTSVFALMIYETRRLQNKKNVQENTHGSAEWKTPKHIAKRKDKVFENNMILTDTEYISKNMRKSRMNRHVLLVGMPGTGKSRYYFKPNILSATGTIIVTDPKGELLKDCGNSLKQKGYTIKVLNLDSKSNSNKYNPFIYIKTKNFEEVLNKDIEEIDESDVMVLINILIANTKSEFIENVSRRSILGKGRNAVLTSIILLYN